jgi:hypothetical protein
MLLVHKLAERRSQSAALLYCKQVIFANARVHLALIRSLSHKHTLSFFPTIFFHSECRDRLSQKLHG